jgi:hypothetical protein
MARRVDVTRMEPKVADQVLDPPESTVLDVLDELLNKGVMATGDVTLGVAGVDLIYLRLSTLLCAADRVWARSPRPHARRRHRASQSRGPKRRK